MSKSRYGKHRPTKRIEWILLAVAIGMGSYFTIPFVGKAISLATM